MDPAALAIGWFLTLIQAVPGAAQPDLDVPVALGEGELVAGQVVEQLSRALESPYAVARGAESLLAEPADLSARTLPARQMIEELALNCRILAWLDGRALVCFDLLQSPSLLEADSRWQTGTAWWRKFLRIPAGEVLASESHLSIPAALRQSGPEDRRSWSRDRAEAKQLCVDRGSEGDAPPSSATDGDWSAETIKP